MLKNHRLSLGLGLVALCGGAVGGCADEIDDGVIEVPVDPANQDVVRSDVAPPPISGGTLLVTADHTRVIAADPDRDRIVVVAAPSGGVGDWTVVETIPLQDGDEPGRVVEDAEGRVHVALRRGGALVTIDPRSGRVLGRRDVCAAPRGLASDGDGGLLVACATGELVSMPGDPSLPATRSVFIERDLRDVVVNDGIVFVSTFRSAQVIRVDADGNVIRSTTPRTYTNSVSSRQYTPTVAWRMVASDDGVSVVHQRSAVTPIEPPPASSGAAYYGGQDCSTSIVHAAITEFDQAGDVVNAPQTGGLGVVVLPVDLAVSPSGNQLAVASAANDTITLDSPSNFEVQDGCELGFGAGTQVTLGNEPIAVAFFDESLVVVQERQPSTLVVMDVYGTIMGSVLLGGERRADTGHELFHRNPDGVTSIACASCHPEGRDDAHTWQFVNVDGGRRTQSLAGGVMDTAPFHWDGDLDGLGDLMTLVFEQRMGGVHQSDERVQVLGDWLDTVPRVAQAANVDADAVARGEALFFDETVACSSCHGGAAFTNDKTVDVGTGKAFQVPGLLGIADRAPFMHDGCATTLADRFSNECGGGDAHGKTSHLSPAEIADLVAYLESL
jgi:mono/diheme cytochrome c family protein